MMRENTKIRQKNRKLFSEGKYFPAGQAGRGGKSTGYEQRHLSFAYVPVCHTVSVYDADYLHEAEQLYLGQPENDKNFIPYRCYKEHGLCIIYQTGA